VAAETTIEIYDYFELKLKGPSSGNPFVDVSFSASFTHSKTQATFQPNGFYDGNGTFIVRFMADTLGKVL